MIISVILIFAVGEISSKKLKITTNNDDSAVRLPHPNISPIYFRCGESIDPREYLLRIFVIAAVTKFVEEGAKKFDPTSQKPLPYFNIVVIDAPDLKSYKLYGTLVCYAPKKTMLSYTQCYNCLQSIRKELILDLCPQHRSGERLVADCYLKFETDHATFCPAE